jgi:hypothetical protein
MSRYQQQSSAITSISTAAYNESSDEEDTLPYPAPLPRSDFLDPEFEPSAYLSTLRNRHQTLEDLRGDLRSRSQLLNKELVDLINGNYEEFLSLGEDLKGGEEKVDSIRLGVLGFQREIEGVRKAVQGRLGEVDTLLEDKKRVRRDIVLGRSLLDIEAQVTELEESLGLQGDVEDISGGDDDDNDFDEEGDDDEDEPSHVNGTSSMTVSLRKLQTHAQSFIVIKQIIRRVGREHPFLVALQPRMMELQKTILLDLATALRQAKASKTPDVVLTLMGLYGDLGAEAEAVKILKAS